MQKQLVPPVLLGFRIDPAPSSPVVVGHMATLPFPVQVSSVDTWQHLQLTVKVTSVDKLKETPFHLPEL